uniref:Uncharacterized protein n=1 Tax=Meloidogyne enterolobii TaxID=390850 RepID=A0A6V7U2G0_MELEN|nr:unnamed protein product [Meloidogyne enterolobii]
MNGRLKILILINYISSFGYSEDDPFIKDLTEKLREHNAELQRKAANRGSSSSSYGNNTDDNDNNLKFENLSITPNKVPKPKRKGNKNSKIGNVSPSSQGSSNDNESNFGVPHVHPSFGHGFEYGYSNSHHNSVDGENHLPYHERTMAGSVNEYGNFGGMPNYGWQHPYPYNSSGFPPNFVPIQPQPHEITHFADTNTDTYSGNFKYSN